MKWLSCTHCTDINQQVREVRQCLDRQAIPWLLSEITVLVLQSKHFHTYTQHSTPLPPPSSSYLPGLNKHFHMVCIQHRLQQSAGQFLTTKQIWEHLETLYDLNSLVSTLNTDCSVVPSPGKSVMAERHECSCRWIWLKYLSLYHTCQPHLLGGKERPMIC